MLADMKRFFLYCRQRRRDLATKGATRHEKLPQKNEVIAEYNKYVLFFYMTGSNCGVCEF